MTTKRKEDGVRLPASVTENDYPNGDGPAWISEALGAPGCLTGVTRFLSDEGDETSLVLHFANGTEQVFRPARVVTTRRLTETLGALGFPIPYYQPPQLALLGQAIGRVADRTQLDEQERSYAEIASLVASWLGACLQSEVYLLSGRAGVDVRAAIEHVRRAYVKGAIAPLIIEPKRVVVRKDGSTVTGALLAWTVPVTAIVRDRLGTKSDGDISLALGRSDVKRARLAARPAPAEQRKTNHELPVWVLYNGWQGVEVVMPDGAWESGKAKLCLL
jgi:hypothetical protein